MRTTLHVFVCIIITIIIIIIMTIITTIIIITSATVRDRVPTRSWSCSRQRWVATIAIMKTIMTEWLTDTY